MKKLLVFFGFFIVFSPLSFSSIEGIVQPVDKKEKKLLLGDSINLKISFWPKDLKLFEEIKKLERDRFLNIFYILDVKKFEISKNNYDVINIFVKAIVVKPYKKTPFKIWNNSIQNIPIEIRKILVKDLPKKNKDIFYYSIEYKKIYSFKNEILLILSLIAFLYLMLKFFRVKKIKEIKRIKDP